MVLSGVVDAYNQAERIKRVLKGLPVFEEKVGPKNVVLSVRIQNASEMERVKEAFKNAGVKDVSEFAEAA